MDTTTSSPSKRITDEVGSWPGVEAGPGRRGEFAFRVGRKEIGHLHGDRAAHFGFPKAVGAELRAQGRVGPHPVAPHKTAWAARAIETDDDVRDVIALMRLNYDRVAARNDGTPSIPKLHPSNPAILPFAKSLEIRAFVLERDAGNLLIYSAPGLDEDGAPLAEVGGAGRQYLNHWHEALFSSELASVPLFVNELDRDEAAARADVRATFSKRHMLDDDFEVIPIPGHTPGATAYLWDSGEHRVLFTGDTLYLRDGEWVAAVLDSSDRESYIKSLELIRELDFDVLAPWAASIGQPEIALTDQTDARARIDAVIARLRDGGNH